ncbi:unnamed protein product [Caenorhabditis auriculariae]|uniref:Histone H2B n=1 Tax=Caenorhabditis auriculariae TaxID=2777116 RepID=A0A8S1GZA3_9PELO|nr:unnamed protein product [Caenorhabditis auriculariae]
MSQHTKINNSRKNAAKSQSDITTAQEQEKPIETLKMEDKVEDNLKPETLPTQPETSDEKKKLETRKRGRPPGVIRRAVDKAKQRKKKRKNSNVAFSYYIHKVLKQVHPDCKISARAMSIMDSMVNDVMEMLSDQSSKLTEVAKRNTVTAREIQTSARLLLPGELAKHAVSEGTKAVTKYMSSISQSGKTTF